MKSFQFKDLMINVGAGQGEALYCLATCRYGTYCGWLTPCGYTCDVGRTCSPYSITHTVLQEQVAAGGAAQFAGGAGAVAGAGGALPCLQFTGCGHFTWCGYFTPCRFATCHFGCSIAITDICRTGPTLIPCQPGTCGVTIDPTPTIQVDPQGVASQLAAVKAQLQQELAAIEQQEKTLSEALRPQTVADVEELQGKLRDAIADLDKRKQELQQTSEKRSKK
jgi:hypothetical protein